MFEGEERRQRRMKRAKERGGPKPDRKQSRAVVLALATRPSRSLFPHHVRRRRRHARRRHARRRHARRRRARRRRLGRHQLSRASPPRSIPARAASLLFSESSLRGCLLTHPAPMRAVAAHAAWRADVLIMTAAALPDAEDVHLIPTQLAHRAPLAPTICAAAPAATRAHPPISSHPRTWSIRTWVRTWTSAESKRSWRSA
jgi:hypothetical protein